MYLSVATSFFDAPPGGGPAWKDGDATPAFLCPVPGYDRHFGVLADLGLRMIPVATTAKGPDMDEVEGLVADDPSIKGMWIVPKYSNPAGWTCRPKVVERLAAMRTAAGDFRVYWDNAYAVHDLTDTPDELADLLAACERAGNPNRALVFGSTSKITFAGAGVAFLGSSVENVAWWLKHAGKRTIGPNRVVQLQHAEFFGSPDGVLAHMAKQREILAPKFATVQRVLERRGSPATRARPGRPERRLLRQPACAARDRDRVVTLAARAGVKLTPAGAPFPHGRTRTTATSASPPASRSSPSWRRRSKSGRLRGARHRGGVGLSGLLRRPC